MKLKANEEQLRKKVDKYELQLRELREGGPSESQTYGGRLRGRIEGSLRGMTRSALPLAADTRPQTLGSCVGISPKRILWFEQWADTSEVVYRVNSCLSPGIELLEGTRHHTHGAFMPDFPVSFE